MSNLNCGDRNSTTGSIDFRRQIENHFPATCHFSMRIGHSSHLRLALLRL